MRWKLTAALIASCVAMAAIATSAEAATKKRPAGQQAEPVQRTVYISRDESGRKRTHIILQRRSFLDPGTTVLPGQRKYSDYANPPYASAIDVLGPGRGYDRQPLGARWEFGGR
jgi:hypothetical protein